VNKKITLQYTTRCRRPCDAMILKTCECTISIFVDFHLFHCIIYRIPKSRDDLSLLSYTPNFRSLCEVASPAIMVYIAPSDCDKLVDPTKLGVRCWRRLQALHIRRKCQNRRTITLASPRWKIVTTGSEFLT